MIDERRFDDAGFQVATQPFAELQFAARRMTPRHHVAVRDDGDLQRAHAACVAGRRRRSEQVVHQRTPRRFVGPHGHRHQQIDVTARFQAAVERRAEQVDCFHRRTEMPLDRGARGSDLPGDFRRNEFSHDARASRCARNRRGGSDEVTRATGCGGTTARG